jgi:nucleoside 2-deoxyribosyltransferase
VVRSRAARRPVTYCLLMICVYVASPFGFSEATRLYYKHVLLQALKDREIEPIDPWDDPAVEDELKEIAAMPLNETRRERYRRINERLGEANATAIARADAMLAVLDGLDMDSGTAAEIGFAAGLGKPIVGLRLDTRLAGDNEAAAVNMQVEHFIRSSGGEIVREVEAAVNALSGLSV